MSDSEESFHDRPLIITEPVKAFLADLFRNLYYNDTVRLKRNYFSEFSELTEAGYKQEEWPTFGDIESLINEKRIFKNDDESFDLDKYDSTKDLFALLYTELCFRHIFLHGKPFLHHRIQSFDNYDQLFEHFLTSSDSLPNLPVEWLADMMDEFLYQFEDFCSYRHQLDNLEEEELEELEEVKNGIFNVANTLSVLEKLASHCDFTKKNSRKTMWNLGYIATLGVSRIHVLVADYKLSLVALKNIDLDDRRALFTRLTSVHVTLFYYTGISYLMLGRYSDAISLFGAILLSHRAIDRNKVRAVCYADAQFHRKYEKIKAFCCIAVALNVGSGLEDNLRAVLDDAKTSLSDNLLSSLRSTENTEKKLEIFEEAFTKSCPRFITPQEPDYKTLQNRHKDTVDIQTKWFMEEVKAQISVTDVKSLLKMYSTISVSKLAGLAGISKPDLLKALISTKYRSQQMVRDAESATLTETNANTEFNHAGGVFQSVSDVHFYLDNETVNVDDKQRKQKFADFFLQNAMRLSQCSAELKSSSSSNMNRNKKKSFKAK